ncbi:hypothetical protein DFQ28_009856 [Apophysomyces sp. BC1034]|nr:hypothetical protein DFQ28_009856 [Apophysomyces sp. BC1034]
MSIRKTELPANPAGCAGDDAASIRHDWTREQIAALFDLPFDELLYRAHTVQRRYHAGRGLQISQLLSIKTGGCPEDCGYCSQSVHAQTELKASALMNLEAVLEAAAQAKAAGVQRFCMGAAWRSPRERDLERVCAMVEGVKALGLETCVTLGMLTGAQAQRLADVGLDYYNHNIDTSPAYYPSVITTRTLDERLDTLEHVRSAGLKVCCGGIVGMGESREDRVGMLQTLANLLTHPESVPINSLMRIEGTRLANERDVDGLEFVRTIAVARIVMPASVIRLSAGREHMSDELQALCLFAGAGSVFVGEKLLTTANPTPDHDRELIDRLGAHQSSGMTAMGTGMTLIDSLGRGLEALDAAHLRRHRRVADSACSARMSVDGRPIVGFANNDYLGLAAHPLLIEALGDGARRYGAGSGGSHLLGGHSRAHAKAEEDLAAFCGGFVDGARALYFCTGYMANLAVLTALAGLDAVIFSDALNHASLIDGTRLSRASVRIYPHCDIGALDVMLRASDAATKVIVSDTVFSMDGDVAPLSQLAALAERHNAWLVLDDAHGFGVLGRDGRGSLDASGIKSEHIVYVGTLGKAAGVAGAFVVAHPNVIEWFVQRARTYIFTTASPPAVAHAVSASVRLIAGDEGRARRAQLFRLISRMRGMLAATPYRPLDSHTAVQPLVIGSNEATLEIAAMLDDAGLWVPAIRPPTVPPGTSRLRISLSAAHTDDDLDRFETALANTIRRAT